MPKLSPERLAELEGFWRHHHDEWVRGTLNQREYCELHGLPLKRFGNWRDRFKGEEKVRTAGLLYRRGGLRHMASHMSDRDIGTMSPGYVPSARATPEVRRNFGTADKRRIVAEACRPGASLSAIARRHRIDTWLLFRWKQQLAPQPEPVFLSVAVSDAADAVATPSPVMPASAAAPIIVERQVHEIEVELTGGRRVRFGRDTDPETVRAMIAVLEGAAS
jgi:transposase